MAVSAAPFALKNLAAGLDAEQLRQAVASLVPNAGGLVQSGDLAVTQTTVASLGVLVGVGRAWMPGTVTANVSGQSYSTQGQYFALNDAPVTVTLDPANATNPRIDLIYIGAVDTQYGGASDKIWISKVTGAPAATPVVPTLPANSIALGQVAVAANATNVTNANITAIASIPTTAPARGVMAKKRVAGGGSYAGSGIGVVDNLASITFVGGRHYEITWQLTSYNGTVNGTYAAFDINTCSTADAPAVTTGLTQLDSATFSAPTSGYGQAATFSAYYDPTVTTTVQIKFTMRTVVGTQMNLPGYTWTIKDLGAQY